MNVSRFALLLALALSVSPASSADFLNTPRCGDCWCITDSDDGNTCPTDMAGITDTFSETDTLYSTFELLNDPDFLKLQSADGNPCFPFADTLNNIPVANYPESEAPQCVSPDEDDDTVCGYVYDSSSATCEGRKYNIQNFPSMNDAMGSNAAILHQGACGVCSSAQDFGARIKSAGTLETESIVCATSYIFSRDFPALVSCYEALGFTIDCATLWAHFAAINGSKCAFKCMPGATGVVKLNGLAPQCEPSECFTCQENYKEDFDRIAGIEFAKAGITERFAHDCNDFYRVIHDPCLGFDSSAAGDGSAATASTPVEDEVPVGSTSETLNNEDDSAGNYIHTTLCAMAVTLTLSLLGTLSILM